MLIAASWNVNSLRVRMPQLTAWLAANPVDVIGLQETKLTDEFFPRLELEALGYQCAMCGEKTYNGVALLSRQPLEATCLALPGFEDSQRRVVAATSGGVRYVNIYVPNGQSQLSQKFQYKLRWLEALRAWLAEQRAEHPRMVVMGDFNIAPEDRDVHDPSAWAGQIMCSTPERAAMRGILDAGFVDTFRLFDQPANVFTWWDYRAGALRRNLGLRIDLVLASTALAPLCSASRVDPEPRRADRPSDHAPVLASFDI